MAESMKESCKLGVAAYAAQPREQWVLEWPGQVVLAVTAIFWTSAVTNALKNGIPGQSTSLHVMSPVMVCTVERPSMLQLLQAPCLTRGNTRGERPMPLGINWREAKLDASLFLYI